MRKHYFCLAFLLLIFSWSLAAATRSILPANAAIIITPTASEVQHFAALELQKHLQLICGTELPIRSELGPEQEKFFIGAVPAGVDFKPIAEQCHWWVRASGVWLAGEDSLQEPMPEDKTLLPRIVCQQSRTGTMTAVYDFLEKQFGVLWLEPGDHGISHPTTPGVLTVTIGDSGWEPGQLKKRGLRTGLPNKLDAYNAGMLEPFQLTHEEFEQKSTDIRVWLKRMRMGTSLGITYGHAFTTWWNKYGATHPEYFALHKGKREPARPKKPDTIKMCPSNPGFHQQIIDEWLAKKPPLKCINTCENDWGDYCECEACRALDMPPAPGKEWDHDLTDRYLYLANTISRMALKHDPDVIVSMYAYSSYRFPPRREKVLPNLVIGFVPSMMEYEETAQMYQQWRQAGAQKLFLRPNDHHVNTGFPMGIEKQMFDAFQLGVQSGIIGTDYDSIHNFWAATGIADYILARAHCYPKATFEQLENEYYDAFGEAREEVSKYYRYWRNEIWEKRLVANRQQILERGRYGNFRRGIVWDLHKYYFISDFDHTDALLTAALARPGLTAQVRTRLANLQLANLHFRLTHAAITAKPQDKFAAAKSLISFRMANLDRLHHDMRSQMVHIEHGFGDLAGVHAAWQFRDYTGFQALPTQWRFQIDEENIGPQQKWELTSAAKLKAVWEPINVSRAWEQQELPGMHPKLREKLRDYDGYGYYGLEITVPPEWRGADIALLFGAVDESCWVWVNGKPAGERIYQGGDDWKTPFAIPITAELDWEKPTQTLIVRVHDSGGQGGVWKPVNLVKK